MSKEEKDEKDIFKDEKFKQIIIIFKKFMSKTIYGDIYSFEKCIKNNEDEQRQFDFDLNISIHHTRNFHNCSRYEYSDDKHEVDMYYLASNIVSFSLKENETPLYIASRDLENSNFIKIIETLVSNGAKLNIIRDNKYILHLLCKHMHNIAIKKIIFDIINNNNNIDINVVNNKKETMLHIICNSYDIYYDFHNYYNNNYINDFIKIITTFIENGANINLLNDNNETPLIVFCKKYDIITDIIKLLVSHENINIVDKNNETCLHILCKKNISFDLFGFLIRIGADIHIKNNKNENILYHLCQQSGIYDNLWIIQYILNNKIDVCSISTDKDNKGETPLQILYDYHNFKDQGDCNIITSLFVENGANLDALNEHKHSILHTAIKTNNIYKVKSLLNFNAYINTIGYDDNTPLHFALSKKNNFHDKNKDNKIAIIKLLLDHNPNFNLYNINGETPIDILFSNNKNYKLDDLITIINLFLKKNYIVDIYEINHLHKMLSHDNYGNRDFDINQNININNIIFKLFLDNGVDISKTTDNNLHQLFSYINISIPINIIETFIEKNTDINSLDKHENTSLHILFREFFKKDYNMIFKSNNNHDILYIIKLLLEKGLNINIQNDKGQTPLHILCKEYFDTQYNMRYGIYNHNDNYDILQIVKLLLEKDLNINIQDLNGQTPLHILCNRNFYFYGMDNENMKKDIINIIKLFFEKDININIRDLKGHTPLDILKNLSNRNDNIELIQLFTQK